MLVSGEEERACEVYHVGAGGNVNSLGEGDVAILTRFANKRNYINVIQFSKPGATHEFGCVFRPRVDECRILNAEC